MSNKKHKVLVAEDDKFLVKIFRDELEKKGFNVIIALDGNEAMLKIKKEKPSLVLLDLIMPIKNGFEVLKEMKLSDELKNIPIIILSNLGQKSDIKKGLELGAIDYLVKSDVSINDIVRKVKKHFATTKLKK